MSEEQKKGAWAGSYLPWSALGVAVLLTVTLMLMRKDKKAEAAPEEKAVDVRILEVTRETVRDIIVLPGRIVPSVQAVLSTEKAGRIVELLVEKGDSVSAGEVMLRVDQRSQEASLKRATIMVQDAERDFKRKQQLKDSGALPLAELDSAALARDLAGIALEEARISLEQCEVRSPMDGIVVDRYVEQGERVSDGVAVFKVANTSKVKVAFHVPERNVFSVRASGSMNFSVDAHAGETFAGKVTFVSAVAERESNSFPVELTTDNGNGRLRAGMIADVQLLRGLRKDAIIIPLSAVVPQRGRHVVFVVEDDHAVRRIVNIGAMMGHRVVIESGVSAGERVVVQGHRRVQDGVPVNVIDGVPDEEKAD